MTLFTSSAYKPLRTLNTFNHLFTDLERVFTHPDSLKVDFTPKANVIEREKDYLVELELPAVSKKDVEVSFKDNTLIVKGKRKQTHTQAKEDRYTRIESHYGQFERHWGFEDVDGSAIEASSQDGLLNIILPKKVESIAKSERKVIDIK